MTTKREYAISLGLAQPTRGRMSREAHAAIAKAEAEGMKFTEPNVLYPTKAFKPPKSVTVSVPRHKPMEMAVGESYDPDRRRYERTQMFTGTDSRYSLTGHECSDPTVLVGGGERIKVKPV